VRGTNSKTCTCALINKHVKINSISSICCFLVIYNVSLEGKPTQAQQ